MPRLLRANAVAVFIVVALLVVLGSLWYSNRLVSQLAAQQERLVQFYSASLQYIYNNPGDKSDFLLENVLIKSQGDTTLFNVPAIISDSTGQVPLQHNLDIPENEDSLAYLKTTLADMRTGPYAPIEMILPGQTRQYVWFQETAEIQQLRYWPIITLGVLLSFISLAFLNWRIAQHNQLNRVWVGLAKETAHQLGTPLTAMLGWIELLRMRATTEPDTEVAESLAEDVAHLQVIADRFQKIGSRPELTPTNIGEVVGRAVAYYQRRMPDRVHLHLNNQLDNGQEVPLSPTLFEWVIENLLKNALDAEASVINVRVFPRQPRWAVVEVQDDGRGIPRNLQREIFKPGFTTKKRGWGLGLSLVRRIIRDYHRGRIQLRFSDAQNGTCFRVQVPTR